CSSVRNRPEVMLGQASATAVIRPAASAKVTRVERRNPLPAPRAGAIAVSSRPNSSSNASRPGNTLASSLADITLGANRALLRRTTSARAPFDDASNANHAPIRPAIQGLIQGELVANGAGQICPKDGGLSPVSPFCIQDGPFSVRPRQACHDPEA